MKEAARHGDRAKHSSRKHDAKSKHTAKTRREPAKKTTTATPAVKKAATTEKPRKLTLDGSVALCSARAVAESLRLALGVAVADEDVLGLYWSAATDADAGISIRAALRAAQSLGWGMAGRDPDPQTPITGHRDAGLGPATRRLIPLRPPAIPAASVILGLDLPHGEPHAVVAHDGWWWSWGEPYDPADFPGAVVEEAWAVSVIFDRHPLPPWRKGVMRDVSYNPVLLLAN